MVIFLVVFWICFESCFEVALWGVRELLPRLFLVYIGTCFRGCFCVGWCLSAAFRSVSGLRSAMFKIVLSACCHSGHTFKSPSGLSAFFVLTIFAAK